LFDARGWLDRPPETPVLDEELILVDGSDRITGYRPKEDCHDGNGMLHRAFSVLLFDPAGRTLLQQRSRHKRLWPGYWSNACCSHPRRGETRAAAAGRRMVEELGVTADLEHLYTFTYHARFGVAGSEHEVCAVFAGVTTDEVRADPAEIAAWRWLWPDDLDREMAAEPDSFTPWFRMEWQRVRSEHARLFER
jgi:isopentenyl-diphosphate delta-isomerase